MRSAELDGISDYKHTHLPFFLHLLVILVKSICALERAESAFMAQPFHCNN